MPLRSAGCYRQSYLLEALSALVSQPAEHGQRPCAHRAPLTQAPLAHSQTGRRYQVIAAAIARSHDQPLSRAPGRRPLALHYLSRSAADPPGLCLRHELRERARPYCRTVLKIH
eukprot:2470018-Rhodomonas_salina.2